MFLLQLLGTLGLCLSSEETNNKLDGDAGKDYF